IPRRAIGQAAIEGVANLRARGRRGEFELKRNGRKTVIDAEMDRGGHTHNGARPVRAAGRRRIEVLQLSRAVPAVGVVILLFGIFGRELVDQFPGSGGVIESEIFPASSEAEIGVKFRAGKTAAPVFGRSE